MAFHAGLHRDVLLSAQHVPFGHRAMAGLAGHTLNGDVLFVIERNVVRNSIHRHPPNLPSPRIRRSQLDDVRAVLFHRPVATHAKRRWRKRGEVPGIRHRMALFALHPRRAHMHTVAERQRLFGRRPLHSRCRHLSQAGDSSRQRQQGPKSHRRYAIRLPGGAHTASARVRQAWKIRPSLSSANP